MAVRSCDVARYQCSSAAQGSLSLGAWLKGQIAGLDAVEALAGKVISSAHLAVAAGCSQADGGGSGRQAKAFTLLHITLRPNTLPLSSQQSSEGHTQGHHAAACAG